MALTIEQLIAQQRSRIAALLAERKPHSDTITRLMDATAADPASGRAERDLTESEATEARSARDERARIDAQVQVHQARLDEYEAERRDQEAVDALQRQVGSVLQTGPVPGAGEQRVGGAVVTRGERTYRADTDPKGKNFLRDVVAAHFGGYGAQASLHRHMEEERVERAEYMVGIEQRAAGTGAFAGLVVPQYLTDEFAPAVKAARPLANAMRVLPLPETGMTVNIGRVTTATTATVVAENTTVSETNIDDTLLSPAVQLIAGSQTLSRAAVDRGVGTDEVTIEDLMGSYGTALDALLINQATNGLTNVATNIAYTDASPTAAELYPKVLQAIGATVSALKNQGKRDVFVLMNVMRWFWLQSQLSSTFPLIGQGFQHNVAGEVDGSAVYGSGFAGYLPSGTPVVLDDNISTTLGAGTEDEIYCQSKSQCILWEDLSAPLLIRTDTGPSMKAVGVDIVVYGYAAYTFVRQPHARKISGTGLIAPTF